MTETTTSTSIGRVGAKTRARQPGRRKASHGRSSLAVRGLAATLAAAAVVSPAVAFVSPAAAATKSSLLAQGKAAMLQTNATEESHHTIPFKRGTNFTIACALQGTNVVLCREHSGPERCVGSRPWILLTDLFPIIHGRLGESLTAGLTWTYDYCTK